MEATKGDATMTIKKAVKLERSEPFKYFIISSNAYHPRLLHMSVAKGYVEEKGYGALARCGRFLVNALPWRPTSDTLASVAARYVRPNFDRVTLCLSCGSKKDYEEFVAEAEAVRVKENEELNAKWAEERRTRDIEENWDMLWNGLEKSVEACFVEAAEDDEVIYPVLTAGELARMFQLVKKGDKTDRLYGTTFRPMRVSHD